MNGEWQPAFAGQRPPFPVRHGAFSLRVVAEDAQRLLAELRARHDVTWLADVDVEALESYCFAVAQVRRLRLAVAEDGPQSQRSLNQLAAWERRLDRIRSALGFDPLSRERMGRDAAVARAVAGQHVEAVRGAGREHVSRAVGSMDEVEQEGHER